MPDEPIAPTAAPTQQPVPNMSDWRSHVTDDLKADPVVSAFMEKASEKDVPAVVKGYAHAMKRLGSAVNLPGKDAKPEDVAAFKQKVYESGIFQAPPADPKAYDFNKYKDKLPEGLRWSDDLSSKFATALHKHGVPAAALDDLIPLYHEAITGAGKSLKTDYDSGMVKLKQEHGEKFDERQEAVRRIFPAIFKDPEDLQFAEEIGLANHPRFLGLMMRLAPLALADSSFMETVPHLGGDKSGEEAKAELAKIMSDPTHPDHAGYKRADEKVMAKIREMYKAAYGTAPYQIGQGVTV